MRMLLLIIVTSCTLATRIASAAEELDGRVHIDFDETRQPDLFSDTTALRDKYRAFGIRFEGRNSLSGGAIVNEDGNFGVTGHSAPNFYAFNPGARMRGGGSPSYPGRLIFDTVVANVQMKVGSSVDGTAMLTCFDRGMTQVGTVTLTLGTNLQPLAVNGSGIAICELTSTADQLVVDDLVFQRRGYHRCAVRQNDGIKCWGSNRYGQLGRGDVAARGDDTGEIEVLTSINLGTDFVPTKVATGVEYSCAVARNGRVKCWGHNDRGQLGLGDRLDRGDSAAEMGNSLPVLALGGERAVDVAAGPAHACALLESGAIRCWGDGASGQLGQGNTVNIGDDSGEFPVAVALGRGRRAVALALGKSHTCALLDDATIKCWGAGDQGQLGSGRTENIGVRSGQMGDALAAVALGDFNPIAITAGDAHSCALGNDGTARCWGGNGVGQLGLGDTQSRGDNPNEMGDYLQPVNLGTNQFATDLACAGMHCCVRFVQGSAKCWGSNSEGQLGLGDLINRGARPQDMGDELLFVPMRDLETVESMMLNRASTCMTTQRGLFCWGSNLDGQLGTGDALSRGGTPESTPDKLSPVPL